MKIKNVVVGGYIQSKKDSKQLIAGHCYQVADKDISDKTVKLVSIDNSFDDSLWFCVSDFRKPKPKQLDQSVFNGLDEKWRFAAVDEDGECWTYTYRPAVVPVSGNWTGANKPVCFGTGYDTSNWQNSLIERDDIAKELLEVDLSSELTGSDLCRKMLERGDKFVMCQTASGVDVVSGTYEDGFFVSISNEYEDVKPINNQGEPLTASEVGL